MRSWTLSQYLTVHILYQFKFYFTSQIMLFLLNLTLSKKNRWDLKKTNVQLWHHSKGYEGFSLPHCLRVSKPQLAGQISAVEFQPPFWNFGWIEAGGNLLWYLSFLTTPQIPSPKTQPAINKIWPMVSCNFLDLGKKAELLPEFASLLSLKDEGRKWKVQGSNY